jgi:hypothetical protein
VAKKTKAVSKLAEIAGKIVTLLEPLSPEDRQNVINGSLTLLGDAPTGGAPASGASASAGQASGGINEPDHGRNSLPAKATTWLKQNNLTLAQIERVFDITPEGVTVIASEVPGANDKTKTHNGYVLQGISRLLASGEPTFDDNAARKVCQDLGCFNRPNHATYMSDKGNVVTGSKSNGWKLTAPGLKHGAELVKELTKEE